MLGHALRRTGDAAASTAAWQEALTLFADIGTPEADQVRDLLDQPVSNGGRPGA